MSLFTVSLGLRRSAFGVVVVAGALCMTACSSVDEPKPAVPPRTIELPGRHLVTVGERDAGATIVLDAAQELSVRLPLDSLDVTAGLDWLLVSVKPDVLASGVSKFERGPRDSNNEELGGDVVWRFMPQAAGSTTLRFDLKRTHSLDPPTRSASYIVRVK